MNMSIEIIGEVIADSSSVSNSMPDLQILYDESSSSSSCQIAPVVPFTMLPMPQRPVRTRRPIRKLLDEQLERPPKRRRTEPKTPRQFLYGKRTLKRSTVNRPLMTLARVKNGSDIEIISEVKRKTRVEIGGAGTMKTKRKLLPDEDVEIVFQWDPAKVIAERQSVEEWQARNVINMFDQENTLPFIARYRREKTGNLQVEKLREIQNSYSQLKHIQDKIVKILKDNKKVAGEQKTALLRATTVHEVEHLTTSLKGSSKRKYAEKARDLGLNPYAEQVMKGQTKYNCLQDFNYIVNPVTEGLRTAEQVEQGIKYIIADIVSKEPEVLDFIRYLMRHCRPLLECVRKKKSEKSKSAVAGPSEELCDKYKLYFNFSIPAWNLRPHQVMAINRGESKGVLSVKVVIPEAAHPHFSSFCKRKWLNPTYSEYHSQLILTSIEDSWERLVKPFMQRQIRSQLTEMAEISSVEVFTSNLKKLLLTPPVRGKMVLAIDPGFNNGCKIAVTNSQGEVLITTTIYPFRNQAHFEMLHWSKDHNAKTLREIVIKYRCEIFAIGNGKACRQTEQYLTHLIKMGCFASFNVQYTIVNESGVSQYSITPEAREELPDMDPNHISAVSLARRLQDPLLEYVKIHPMHLGVGMYQHDIPERLLHASLDSVMTECVSFIGVDINVASEFVLRKLSGLTKTRAAKIVEYRRTKGLFLNRDQLMSVKGIGPKTFEQCAGFIKIIPATLESELLKTPNSKRRYSKDTLCTLDQTMIHPESYESARKLMGIVGLHECNIGTDDFLRIFREFTQRSSLETISKECGVSVHTIQVIIEGLSLPLDYDIRAQFEKPLFRNGIISIDDVALGTILTGKVQNITTFGAFVDVGVGIDGLIHSSNLNGMRLELGNVVEVLVNSVEKERRRIGLSLERVL